MLFIEKPSTSISSVATMIESGFVSKTGNASVDALLSRGGIKRHDGDGLLDYLDADLRWPPDAV